MPTETLSHQSCRKTNVNQPEPIFIVGAPRSGTSLLRTLLNRHPSIALCDETYYFYYVYNRRGAFGDLQEESSRRHLVSRYLETNRIKALDLDLRALSDDLMKNGKNYDSLFLSLMQFYTRHHGKMRYGEKTPQHAQNMASLQEWYPNGKLIHLVRDPRDVVASLQRMPWASNNVLANARTWLSCNLSIDNRHSKVNYLLVRYEHLVNAPEKELKRICDFIGETFSTTMLETSEGTFADNWWFQRALEPISKDRIRLWSQQLTPRQIALIEGIVGVRMREFGYEPSGHIVPLVTRTMALFEEVISSVKAKFQELPRVWYHWFQPTHLVQEEAWIDKHR